MSKLIVNCETGETVERELNKAEKDQEKKDALLYAEAQATLLSESEAKASQRQAILDRLGLTSEEAALLLS